MRKLRKDGHFSGNAVFFHLTAHFIEPASHHEVQSPGSMGRNQETVNFFLHPFQRKPFHPGKGTLHAFHQTFVRHEIKLPQKAAGPEHAERIFVKPVRCMANGTEPLLLQILQSMEVIIETAIAIQRHGIHGEIPAAYIFLQTVRKRNFLRPVGIGSIKFPAKSSDLIVLPMPHHNDRTKTPSTTVNGLPACSPGNAHGFLRPGRGGDIPVMGHKTHEKVPDTASYHIGLFPLFIQFSKDCKRPFIDFPCPFILRKVPEAFIPQAGNHAVNQIHKKSLSCPASGRNPRGRQ